MKHIKLFEQFINEGVSKKDLKKLQDMGYHANLENGEIAVIGENPWNDGRERTFYWDGKEAYFVDPFGGANYQNGVKSAQDFSDAINDQYGWNQ